ncbi:UPF0481 protein At3g47200-like [Cornus florida]|uniref:UPF0481 protein At3g47200-like n=1 Tax=Cornus florida TaxID=4283 RepID=UPI002899A640|nr:UPF0481 protein At3g47200-like [Cornus florida]
MAKSDDDELSSINLAEAGKEASRELGVEITELADNELSRINSAVVGEEAGRELGDEWIISIDEERPNASSYKPLQKVPRELREEEEENKGFFNPKVVSIGPYHRGKPEFKEAEKLKNIAARAFIAGCRNGLKLRVIYNEMLEVVNDLRNCYIEGSTVAYDDVAFARMMLLDGCFMLRFISSINSQEIFFLDELIKHVGVAGFRGIIADTSLLENQLPFLVLQTLINSTQEEGKWEKLMEEFIARMYIDDNAKWMEKKYKHEKEQPLHFLHLIRRRFIGQYSPADEEVYSRSVKIYQDDGPGRLDDQPRPRRSFKTVIPCWPKRRHRKSNPHKDIYTHSFRSATQLKAKQGAYISGQTPHFH